MQRRDLLKAMASAGLLPMTSLLSSQAAAATRYEGDLFLVISADGGWDVTSFCDPKDGLIVPSNQTTAVPINHWRDTGSIATTANGIQYAPFGDNASLFTNHGDKMMVINGIDTQTNAHSAGVRHTFSGRFGEGYPALTALMAAEYGAGLPLAFLSNGGYRETGGLTTFTLMNDPGALEDLVQTNTPPWGPSQYHRPESLSAMSSYKQQRLDRMQARAELSSRLKHATNFMESSVAGRDQLVELGNYMPAELVESRDVDGNWFPMLRQIQLFLVSAAAGLTVAGDVRQGGYDTHDNHDEDHSRHLRNLAHGIDFLWAEAARMDTQFGTNLSGRLNVLIASDFSRTPWYNDGNGKDHWPISSAILMRQSGFTQAVVGGTSATHDALGLDAALNVQPEGEGELLTPAHLHRMMRFMTGTEAYNTAFPLDVDAHQVDLRGLV